MASDKFNRMKKSQNVISDSFSEFDKIKELKLLAETAAIQKEIKEQSKNIKKDYKKNKTIYSSLYDELLLLKKKQNKPKFDKSKNLLERNGGDGSGSSLFGTILSTLFSGLSMGKLLIKPLTGLIKRGLAKSVSALAKNSIRLAAPIGRTAVSAAARLLGGAVAGASGAAATVGMPLLIASAAAAVGYGTYKLGRYLKLSERLDDFIKKVSNGKYRDLVDFIMAIGSGEVAKDIYNWVKDKISGLFNDAVLFLKNKTNDILGRYSIFANDPETEMGGGAAAANNVSNNPNAGSNSSSNIDTSANDAFTATMNGSGYGAQQSSSSSIEGDLVASGEAIDLGGSDLAFKLVSNNIATKINSHPGMRDGRRHNGVDIQADMNTPIYALADGTVRVKGKVTDKTGSGLATYLTTDDGYTYTVMHMNGVSVKDGARVSKGQQLGISGNSGRSTGPHIHFEVHKDGKWINPVTFKLPNSQKVSVAKNSETSNSPVSTKADKKSDKKVSSLAQQSIRVSPPKDKKTKKTKDSKVVSSLGSQYTANSIDIKNSFTELNSSETVNVLKADESTTLIAKIIDYSKLTNTTINNPGEVSVNTKTSPKMPNLMAASNSSPQVTSKSLGIESNKPSVMDPRGALNPDIILSATSPLFV